MKFTIPRTFDFSILKDSKTYKDNVQFFDWINQFTDTVVRGFTNQVTIQDNMDCIYVNQEFKTNTALNLLTKGRTPKAVVFGGASYPITNYFWSMNKNGLLDITVNHNYVNSSGVASPLLCNFIIFF